MQVDAYVNKTYIFQEVVKYGDIFNAIKMDIYLDVNNHPHVYILLSMAKSFEESL